MTSHASRPRPRPRRMIRRRRIGWQAATQWNAIALVSERFGKLELIVVRRRAEKTREFIRTQGGLIGSNRTVARATQVLKLLPSDDELRAQINALEQAIHKPATLDQICFVVGAIFEGIPSAAKAVTPSLIDATAHVLAHDPECFFSAPVIWSGGLQMLRVCKFTPSPCEFLEASHEARGRYADAVQRTWQLLEIRDDAECLLDLHAAGSCKLSGKDLPF